MKKSCVPLSEPKVGPSVWMETVDHATTLSNGSSRGAKAYRRAQQELIDNNDFRGAVQMDIVDLRRPQFGSKYEQGIQEMVNYLKRLERSEPWRFLSE